MVMLEGLEKALMTANPKRRNAVPVSDVASAILDPLMRKRAGVSVALVQSWDEIVGERLAPLSRPERIQWPRRRHEDDLFEPATLVIACGGAAALHIQHQSGEIIDRVNSFLGFAAIARIRIEQKPVTPAYAPKKLPRRELSQDEAKRIDRLTAGIEDDRLRASLARLGSGVVTSRGD